MKEFKLKSFSFLVVFGLWIFAQGGQAAEHQFRYIVTSPKTQNIAEINEIISRTLYELGMENQLIHYNDWTSGVGLSAYPEIAERVADFATAELNFPLTLHQKHEEYSPRVPLLSPSTLPLKAQEKVAKRVRELMEFANTFFVTEPHRDWDLSALENVRDRFSRLIEKYPDAKEVKALRQALRAVDVMLPKNFKFRQRKVEASFRNLKALVLGGGFEEPQKPGSSQFYAARARGEEIIAAERRGDSLEAQVYRETLYLQLDNVINLLGFASPIAETPEYLEIKFFILQLALSQVDAMETKEEAALRLRSSWIHLAKWMETPENAYYNFHLKSTVTADFLMTLFESDTVNAYTRLIAGSSLRYFFPDKWSTVMDLKYLVIYDNFRAKSEYKAPKTPMRIQIVNQRAYLKAASASLSPTSAEIELNSQWVEKIERDVQRMAHSDLELKPFLKRPLGQSQPSCGEVVQASPLDKWLRQ